MDRMIEPLSKKVNGKTITEYRAERKARDDRNWREVCEAVDARDKGHCRVCGRWANPYAVTLLDKLHRHHIIFLSAGGQDTTDNVLSACAKCHDDVHVNRTLALEGDADLRDPSGRLCGVQVSRLTESGWAVERMV